jgi:hypothetical protein
MLALLDTEVNESELLQCFIEKCVQVKAQSPDAPPKFAMNVFAIDDGFVYHFDGVYAFASKENMIRQIIISSPDRFGLTMIDTRKVSKTHKALIRKIESFVSILTPLLAKMLSNELIVIEIKNGYTLSDIREQLIKNSSL